VYLCLVGSNIGDLAESETDEFLIHEHALMIPFSCKNKFSWDTSKGVFLSALPFPPGKMSTHQKICPFEWTKSIAFLQVLFQKPVVGDWAVLHDKTCSYSSL